MFKNRNKKSRKAFLKKAAIGLTLCALPVATAYAQIEEIVVFARKIEESLQEVPISVTAITGANLKDAGVTEFPELAAVTPNFDVRSDETRGEFAAVLNIRGQSSTSSDLSIDQAVGINVNGAPITRGTNLFGNLFDIEQIEILRGPQGTLFGKNTTGGTVIVRTTAPQLGEFSGYVEGTLGNFKQSDVEGVLNIPISDTIALRVGAALTNRDGFADGVLADGTLTGRDFGDDNEEFFRASLLIEPSDDLSIRINVDTHEVEENSGPVRVLRTGLLFGIIPIATQTPGDDIFQVSDLRTSEPELSAEETNINATINLDVGFADLTSITSFRDQESFTFLTYAPSADVPIGQESELFTQELRLSGVTDSLAWQTGLFMSKEQGEDFNDVGGRGDLTNVENDSFSAFAQATFNFSENLNLTAGARWTEEERFVDRIETGGVPVDGLDNQVDFDAVSWTIALDYNWTPEVLTYASISRGFRSGGIDGDNDINTIVQPEYVLNYEAGFKADLLEDTLRFNTSIWSSDYTDIQISSFTLDPDNVEVEGVPISILRNAAEATLQGFESELLWFPSADLAFTLGVGYIDGEYDNFSEPRQDPITMENFQFDRSDEPIGGPEWQFNATARYGFDIGQNTRATAQLSYTFIDERDLASPALSARFDPGQATIDSINLLNGQIDFSIGDDLNIALWGTNLADKKYFSNGFAVETLGLLLAQRNVGAPRQFGIRLRKDF